MCRTGLGRLLHCAPGHLEVSSEATSQRGGPGRRLQIVKDATDTREARLERTAIFFERQPARGGHLRQLAHARIHTAGPIRLARLVCPTPHGAANLRHPPLGRGDKFLDITTMRAVGQQMELAAGTVDLQKGAVRARSEEHTSELQSLMRISYAVFCLKKKKKT